jgi:hypothetical protein
VQSQTIEAGVTRQSAKIKTMKAHHQPEMGFDALASAGGSGAGFAS